MLLVTVFREWRTVATFDRHPEVEPVTQGAAAVAAFAQAARPGGILSGVHAFYARQACRMVRPGDRVLDLGCGPASLLAAIAERRSAATFVGIDRSAAMVAAGRALIAARRLRNVELRLEDMSELPTVDSGTVDVVFSSMALHHLPDLRGLRGCLKAVERVMAPGARLFIADFGRLKCLESVEYFVRRAIPRDEPLLERDYRASLRAAFSKEEIAQALPPRLASRMAVYSTAVSPVMVVVMTPFPDRDARASGSRSTLRGLPRARQADYWQLRLFLRLGGMPLA